MISVRMVRLIWPQLFDFAMMERNRACHVTLRKMPSKFFVFDHRNAVQTAGTTGSAIGFRCCLSKAQNAAFVQNIANTITISINF